MKTLKPLLAAIAAVLFLPSMPALAYDERIVLGPNGTEVLRIRFHGVGDGEYVKSMPGEPVESTWDLKETQKKNLLVAASYWAEVLRPKPGGLPAIVNVGTMEAYNAYATGVILSDGKELYTGLQAAFQLDEPLPEELLDRGAHGLFVMGRMDYDDGEYLPSQMGESHRLDLASVAVHEMGHLLGVSSLVGNLDGKATPYFSKVLDAWAKHLVDDNGNRARPGQAVLCADCRNAYDPDAFDARLDKAMFVGENVLDALEGGLPGVPVKMMREVVSGGAEIDSDYMSHIELRNSLMSHQSYRNYARFMEAELALLQDLGHTLDRRNFFGRSIYGSGQHVVNDRGFHARNAEGTAYLPGQYNTATVGLGLHVYGSRNHVRQTADLLSAGHGGAGIRVDGEGNTFVVDPGVRIHALGLNGQGIMFTYGKGHQLVHRGEVLASGLRGVGLRFDFGTNMLGSSRDYRGSYIRTSSLVAEAPMLPELQGALVDRVDITGTVAGSAAALYMSSNALVDRVNIMQGARIEGDIVSDYAQRDETGALRLATISFGQRADAAGRATGAADENFAMRYAGDIRGRNNLHVSLDGGATLLDGRNELHGLTVQPGAALGGNGHFAISPEGVLRNDGLMAPGYPATDAAVAAGIAVDDAIGRIEVDGDYEQGSAGVLFADFTPAGTHDVVAVAGTASLDGTLAVQATPGWYASNWAVDAPLVDATHTEGNFSTVLAGSASSTLRFSATPLSGGAYRLSAIRGQEAYSRHAADDNGRRAGQALQRAGDTLASDPSRMQGPDAAAFGSFLTALDFSAPDGSEVRQALGQISPAGYSAGVSASLHRERDVMDVALQGVRAPSGKKHGVGDAGNAAAGNWQGFASIFGGKADQEARGSALGYDVSTYGLVVGGTQRLVGNPAVSVGGHLDIGHQSFSPYSPRSGKGRTTSVGLGLQASYAPQADRGIHAWSGLRVGMENASLDRNIAAAGGYRASHSADWTGRSASAVVGAGYRWQLAPGVSAGPVASLNYASVWRPDIDESGNAATRLSLDSERFDALVSSLGLAARTDWKPGNGSIMAAHVQATWDREWLDRDAVQTASFAAVPSVSFSSRNEAVPRNSLGLQAGLSYRPGARVVVGAALNGRFGGGYDAVSGELKVRWAF